MTKGKTLDVKSFVAKKPALVILVVQSRRTHRPEDLYVNRVRAQSAAAEEKEKTPNGSENKTV